MTPAEKAVADQQAITKLNEAENACTSALRQAKKNTKAGNAAAVVASGKARSALSSAIEVLGRLEAHHAGGTAPVPVTPPAPTPDPSSSNNLLPANLLTGKIATNWESISADVALSVGRKYRFTADCVTTNYTGLRFALDGVVLLTVGGGSISGLSGTKSVEFTVAENIPHRVTISNNQGLGGTSWSNAKIEDIGAATGAAPVVPVVPTPKPTPAPAPAANPTPLDTKFLMFTNVGEMGFGPEEAYKDWGSPATNEWLDDLFAMAPFDGIRYCMLWTRLQHVPGGPLWPHQLNDLKRVVAKVTGMGKVVIFDSHDYFRRGYGGTLISSSPALEAQYADYFGKIAANFADNPLVWFNHNEPHDVDAAAVVRVNQKIINAIRAVNMKGRIVLPGTNWASSAEFPTQTGPALLAAPYVDPANNLIVDCHQYLDPNGSGQSPALGDGAANRSDAMIAWCRKNGYKFMIGENGFGNDPASLAMGNAYLTKLKAASDVCVGYAYWCTGAWWGDDWNILKPGARTAQVSTLKKHMT